MRADRVSLLLTYAIAGLGVGAALLHMSPPFGLLLVVFAVVGVVWDLRDHHPLGSWVLTTLIVVGFLVAIALPSPNGPVGRLLAASIILLGGKLLAPKTARDQLQVMLLSLLLLVGSAILTANLSFALLFLLYLVLCTIALMWIPFGTDLGRAPVSRAFVRRVSLVGVGLVIGSLPLLVLFFFGLPRSTAPLIRGMTPVSSQVTGFSDKVDLGDVGQIARSSAVAFRVELPERSGPLKETPYWRGGVLEDTDGMAWRVSSRPLMSVPWEATGPVDLIAQRIYLEPQGTPTLFGLDRVVAVDGPAVRGALTGEGLALLTSPITRRIRYDALSDPAPVWPVTLDPGTRQANLDVPVGLPAVVAERASEVVGSERDPRRQADLLLAHFHGGGYTYSLDPPQGSGHPLDLFLSRTKTGYCEYFASAMALMLRSLGVPSRVVVGYVGGDYNPTGGYYLVRQSSAHAWVEAYIEGRGWIRYDPTPPSNSPAAPGAPGHAGRLALLLDAARHQWDTVVMGYDLDRQMNLVRSLSSGLGRGLGWKPSPADLAVLALLIGALVVAVVTWRRRGSTDPAVALYETLQRRLRRQGLVREPTEGPRDFAARAASILPERADAIRQVTDGYVRARYGGHRLPPQEARRLQHVARKV